MTALASPAPSPAAERTDIHWTQVDAAFWVANVTGAHLGRIDADDRHRFHAFSSYGSSLGSYPTLATAQRAVEQQRTHRRRVGGQRVLIAVTTLAGLAAVAMAAVAVVVTGI